MKKLKKNWVAFGVAASLVTGAFGIAKLSDNSATEVEVVEDTKDIEAYYHEPVYKWIDESWDETVENVTSELVCLCECTTCGFVGDYDELRYHKLYGERAEWINKHWVGILGYQHTDKDGNVWWVQEKDEDIDYKNSHPAWLLCDDGYYYKECGGWKDCYTYIPKVTTEIVHHEDGHYELTKKGYYDVIFDDNRSAWNVLLGTDSTQISTQIATGTKMADTETAHEVRWLYRKVAEKTGDAVNDGWKEIKGWSSTAAFTDAVDFAPKNGQYATRSGVYEVKTQVQVKGMPETMREKTYTITYGNIKGKCQMPNKDGGYLIGFETNVNEGYSYEMLILDCTLLAQGKDAWTYTTGKCGVPENCLWTVWKPQYGYYWTLFRLYDKNGNMLDQDCYGFVNAY